MPINFFSYMFFSQMVNVVTQAWQSSRNRATTVVQQDLSRERFEWEKRRQLEQEEEKRRAQRQQATDRLHDIVKSREVTLLFETWPLELAPSDYLRQAGPQPELKPLKVIVAPPANMAGLAPRLEEGLRGFMSMHYPLHGRQRPVEFLGGAWRATKLRSEASIKVLFNLLESEPTLVLESEIIGHDLSFRIGYWGLAQPGYCYIPVQTIHYQDMAAEEARQRAARWRELRAQLRAHGEGEDFIAKCGDGDAANLTVLEEEERLQTAGIDTNALNVAQRYKIDLGHHTRVSEALVACHCVVAACIADAYHLLHHDTPPRLPTLLPELVAALPGHQLEPLLGDIVRSFRGVYSAIAVDRPAWEPELLLDLADHLLELPDKALAREQVEDALRAWLRLRDVSTAAPSQQLQAVAPLVGPSDREFLGRVRQVLVALGDEQGTQALDTIARGLSVPALMPPRDQADPVAEVRWKAEQGDAEAQYQLGVMYEYGREVPQDETQAVQWYRKAAEQGYAPAQTNLGVMYRQGRGVAQDEALGVQWYHKAAEQGDVQAQHHLGWAYQHGRGVPENETQAVQWYRKAAEQGHKGAQDALAALELEANIRKILRSYPPCPGFWVPPIPGKEQAKFRDAVAKARRICQVKGGERILGLICDHWGWSDDCLVFTNKALYFRDYWQLSGKEKERIPYSQFKKTVATSSFFDPITLPSGHKLNIGRSPTAISDETLVSILNSIRQLVL